MIQTAGFSTKSGRHEYVKEWNFQKPVDDTSYETRKALYKEFRDETLPAIEQGLRAKRFRSEDGFEYTGPHSKANAINNSFKGEFSRGADVMPGYQVRIKHITKIKPNARRVDVPLQVRQGDPVNLSVTQQGVTDIHNTVHRVLNH